MPEKKNRVDVALDIMKLVVALEPTAISLFKLLSEELSGKADSELLDEADAAFERVRQRAKAAQNQ